MSLAVTPARQLALDVDRHGLRPGLRQGLGGQHVLDLGGADAEGDRPERAVGRGVRVAADHGHSGLGQPELRADDVHDALVQIAEAVDPDAELRRVLAQRLHLGPRHRVGDRPVDVQRRGVVVLGGQGEVRAADRPAGLAKAVERLRAGHLVDQVEVDEEQIRLALGRPDDVVVPDLLAQRLAHDPTALSFASVSAKLAFQHPRRQYQGMDNTSGVGVLDKAALVLSALETGPTTLAGLVASTGLARPTAHRLAVALEHHRLVGRDLQGRFVLGPRLGELASAAGEDRLLATAGPVLARLRDITGESAQMFRRQGDYRICVATAERMSGLRDTVPVGTQLTMTAGSAAQVLLAWEEPERMQRGLRGSRYSAVALAAVRRRGWAHSVGEREAGRGLGVGPGPLPLRQGDRGGERVRTDRAALPPAGPAARAGGDRRGRAAERGAAAQRRRVTQRGAAAPSRRTVRFEPWRLPRFTERRGRTGRSIAGGPGGPGRPAPSRTWSRTPATARPTGSASSAGCC